LQPRPVGAIIEGAGAAAGKPGTGNRRDETVVKSQAVQFPDRLHAIAERIKSAYHAERVILYGSYARGEATRDSDVDVLVIAPTKERFYQRMATVHRLVRDLRTDIPLSPVVLTPDEIRTQEQQGNAFVCEILHKGREL
jgi:uncharacterized protein